MQLAFSAQPEPGRITEVVQGMCPAVGSVTHPGGQMHVDADLRAAHRDTEEALKCFRTAGKKNNVPGLGLIVLEPEERPKEEMAI